MIRRASAAGATRRRVAKAARLTPGRIQQIVTSALVVGVFLWLAASAGAQTPWLATPAPKPPSGVVPWPVPDGGASHTSPPVYPPYGHEEKPKGHGCRLAVEEPFTPHCKAFRARTKMRTWYIPVRRQLNFAIRRYTDNHHWWTKTNGKRPCIDFLRAHGLHVQVRMCRGERAQIRYRATRKPKRFMLLWGGF